MRVEPTKEIQAKKQLLARSWPHYTESATSSVVDLELLGFHVQWQLQVHPTAVGKVVDYYAPFHAKECRTQPDLTIHYRGLTGPEGQWDHELWSAQEPYSSRIQGSDGYYVCERDFVAHGVQTGRQIFATGPDLNPLNSDILDNLLNLALEPFYQQSDSVLLHAVAVDQPEGAWVFFGPSGVGKSTLGRWVWQNLGQRIIGTDQVLLSVRDGELWVRACPTFNPDIPRSPEAWCTEPRPIKALIELQQKGEFVFNAPSWEAMKPAFLREVLSFPEDEDRQRELVQWIYKNIYPNCWGQMSYPKGENFWPLLRKSLSIRDQKEVGL